MSDPDRTNVDSTSSSDDARPASISSLSYLLAHGGGAYGQSRMSSDMRPYTTQQPWSPVGSLKSPQNISYSDMTSTEHASRVSVEIRSSEKQEIDCQLLCVAVWFDMCTHLMPGLRYLIAI